MLGRAEAAPEASAFVLPVTMSESWPDIAALCRDAVAVRHSRASGVRHGAATRVPPTHVPIWGVMVYNVDRVRDITQHLRRDPSSPFRSVHAWVLRHEFQARGVIHTHSVWIVSSVEADGGEAADHAHTHAKR